MSIARSYGKKPLGRKVDAKLDRRAETRDAEVYDILGNGLCRVQVQGSNEKIVARYPEGWESNPNFLKEGQSVRIQHRGGLRGLVEIVSLGQTVPTHLPGGDAPVIGPGPDSVLSGGTLTAAPNSPTMNVYFSDTVYRISDTEYYLSEAYVLLADPPPAGTYRYDIVVVGIDGIVHVVQGVAAASPIVPSIPAVHVQIGPAILIPGGASAITQEFIGMTWTTPVPAYVTISITDETLSWSEASTAVRITVYDQYGNTRAGTGTGWYLTLEIAEGNGEVSSVEEGSSTTKVGQHTGTNAHSDFTYTRGQLATDESPSLLAAIEEGYTYFDASDDITLLDANGVPMVSPSPYSEETYLGADEYAVIDTGTIDIDWAAGETQVLSFGSLASMYVRSFANMMKGVYRLVVRQDASGADVLGWNSALSIWWQGTTAPTLTATAVRIDVITFLKLEDGTLIGSPAAGFGKP